MESTSTRQAPVPREFDCKRCGKHVHIERRSDRRTAFCSKLCEKRYWRHSGRHSHEKAVEKVPSANDWWNPWPSRWTLETPFPREFACRECGCTVEIEDRYDQRTVFCSRHCCQRWWGRYHYWQRRKDIAQGHVVHVWQLKERGE